MTEPDPVAIAAQLRKPSGEVGLKIGEFMHTGNASSYTHLVNLLPFKGHLKILEI